jgi:hypothetical protein
VGPLARGVTIARQYLYRGCPVATAPVGAVLRVRRRSVALRPPTTSASRIAIPLHIPLTVGQRCACCVRVLQYVVPDGTHWFHRDAKERHAACEGVANVVTEADAPLVVIIETRNRGLCGAQTLGDIFLRERRPASGIVQSLDCAGHPEVEAGFGKPHVRIRTVAIKASAMMSLKCLSARCARSSLVTLVPCAGHTVPYYHDHKCLQQRSISGIAPL